jgi:hypothetical protein
MLQKFEERRQTPRHGLARVAKIQLGTGTAPLYCVVTDISDGGVRVHSNGFHVPDEFVLLLDGDGPFQNGTYRVVWRRDDDVGAKLVRVA